MLLFAGLRGLRASPQRLPGFAGALSAPWRGLSDDQPESSGRSGTGGGAASPAASDAPAAASAAAPAAAPSEHIIFIDRSSLYNPQPHSHDPAVLAAAAAAAGVHKEAETPLVRHLRALIQFRGGPLTLAEFMSEALTNPQHGYYTQRDVFGAAGDFVTSPEISQMFGELVGIWCVATWQQLGCPSSLHLVELGPGRGTLMADLLRGTAAFPDFTAALSVSMVEVSPVLRRRQWEALRCAGPPPPLDGEQLQQAEPQQQAEQQQQQQKEQQVEPQQQKEQQAAGSGGPRRDPRPGPGPLSAASGWGGVPVSWHRSLEEVQPEGPALYIAHEFLDALPVHQFQRTERGWCERLVDLAAPDSPLHLRMVLSPGPTPAARVLLPRRLRQLPEARRAGGQAIEVCPQGMALAEALAQRVAQHGGAALIVDYGQDAPYEASLQAIKRHEFVGLLEQPGDADLSNRVDYSALRDTVVESGAAADCLGPIPQAAFLLGLGIEARLEALLKGATANQAAALQAGFRRLVGGSDPGAALTDEGMGSSYQAFCIAQRGLQPWPFGAVSMDDEDGEEGGGGNEAAGAAAYAPPAQPAADAAERPPAAPSQR